MFLYHVLLNTDIISVVLLVTGIFVFVTLRLNYYKWQLHRFTLKSQTTISVQHNCIPRCNQETNQFSNISSALLRFICLILQLPSPKKILKFFTALEILSYFIHLHDYDNLVRRDPARKVLTLNLDCKQWR